MSQDKAQFASYGHHPCQKLERGKKADGFCFARNYSPIIFIITLFLWGSPPVIANQSSSTVAVIPNLIPLNSAAWHLDRPITKQPLIVLAQTASLLPKLEPKINREVLAEYAAEALAQKHLERLQNKDSGHIRVERNIKQLTRVFLGPFQNRLAAQPILDKLNERRILFRFSFDNKRQTYFIRLGAFSKNQDVERFSLQLKKLRIGSVKKIPVKLNVYQVIKFTVPQKPSKTVDIPKASAPKIMVKPAPVKLVKPPVVIEGLGIAHLFLDKDKGRDPVTENKDSDNSITSEKEALDDLLEGFDDTSTLSHNKSPDRVTDSANDELFDHMDFKKSFTSDQSKWNLTTLISLSSAYRYDDQTRVAGNTEYDGLSQLKIKLLPELRYKFSENWSSVISASAFYDVVYALKGTNKYTSETLDEHESELEFRDTYIRGTLSDNLDITVGRQIVVWGKSDSIRVLDILNPLDSRELGMADIEDLRLPVAMVKADYYFSQWNLSAIAIPEIRFDKRPAFGSEFYISDRRPLPEDIPDDLNNSEYALALEGIFTGWDLSFHLANVYNDRPNMILNENKQPIKQIHSRLNLAGVATNIAWGNWLFKFESAYIDGLKFASIDTPFARLDLLFGADYSGFSNTLLTVEAANRRILDYDEILSTSIDQTEKDESTMALRYSGNFLREKINIVVLAVIFGNNFDAGAYYRSSVKYEVFHSTSLTFGTMIYQGGDNFLLKGIEKNDRMFFDLRYSF
ncbi:MAG: DUF1302 domain-containing protein [Gammaproteobacteria bacterium]|nr:DUF1302 domain-containing protein [Gammaproteobacteria bacterium]